MEQTRLILIIALSFLSLLLWEAWQRDYVVEKPAEVAATNPGSNSEIPKPTGLTPPTPVPEVSAQPHQSAGSTISVTTDTLELKINPIGGVIESAALLNYLADKESPNKTFHLFDNSAERFFIQQGGLKTDGEGPDHYASFTSAADSYSLKPDEATLLVQLTWTSNTGVSLIKEFTFKRGSYVVAVSYKVKNNSSKPWSFHHYEQLQRTHHEKTQYFIHTFTGAALSSPEQRYEKFSFDDLVETPINQDIQNGWTALLEHYFVSALIPTSAIAHHFYSSSVNPNTYVVGFYGPLVNVQPNETTQVASQLYIGPKLQEILPSVAPGLELTVDYGVLWFIAKLLFSILSFLHGVFGNWGWAIIVLTCIVKLVFFPLSAAGYRSMAKMRRVQPRLLAVRERYINDRPRLNQAMMDLYKEEKINPLGGCFPIIVQIPVFISLYWVILESVELRQAPWIFWIKDLSAMDQYYVLPVLMTISMWLQGKLNPAPLDPIQARVMQIMPFAFGIFFAFFPAGLVLYWFVNNVLSIAQQWQITRAIEKAPS
jgi:YidC/Oxa1 family membrane protein insertase